MTTITLGNLAPHETDGSLSTWTADGQVTHHDAPSVVRELHPLLSHTTEVIVPDEWSAEQVAQALFHLWPAHSAAKAGWLLADDAKLQIYLQAAFDLAAPAGPVALLTNAGLDFISKQMAGAASATAVAKWVALTANATAAAVTDTTLTAEIATGGGGLVRAAAAYAHTTAASTYTLTNTYTANGSDALPVTVAKAAAFDASSAGNMPFETLLGTTATLSASGDSLALTWTVTV